MPRHVLSDDELKALLAADLDALRVQNRRWFWFRSGFILCYLAAMLVGLIFYPDRLLSKFNLPLEMPKRIIDDYIDLRVFTVLSATAFYLVSYWRQWYFSYVALSAVLLAIGNLINDFFTLYIYARSDALFTIQLIIMLRAVIIGFLIMNFLGTRNEMRRLG